MQTSSLEGLARGIPKDIQAADADVSSCPQPQPVCTSSNTIATADAFLCSIADEVIV